MEQFEGLKAVSDEDGTMRPTPEYVAWLEEQVRQLNSRINSLNSIIASQRTRLEAADKRERRRWLDEADSIRGYYDEDEYDRQ